MNLRKTNFYANRAENFEMLNSNFIESPSSYSYSGRSSPEGSFRYISKRLPSQNFSKIVTVINRYSTFFDYQFYFYTDYTNQVYLNESDKIYSITPQSYASENAFFF